MKFKKEDYQKPISESLCLLFKTNLTAQNKRDLARDHKYTSHTVERLCNGNYSLTESNKTMMEEAVKIALQNAKSHIEIREKQLAEFDY